jgi:transcriptional regulator with XRE-family HTH domain
MAKRKGLKIEQLAEMAGVGRATLYQLKDPKVSTARAIADALGITLDRLTREESAATPRRGRAS